MQQKKIAAEKKQAEEKLAYNIIKEWTEQNADKFARRLLSNISKRFTNESADEVDYVCWCGGCDFPLGEDYPENIGKDWRVRYYKRRCEVAEFGFGFVKEFFENHPIEKTERIQDICSYFVSQLVFHTALPELLRNEGFVVSHQGCGCSERIIVELPKE